MIALMALCALVSAETISFETEPGGKREPARVVAITDTLFATVAVVGTKPASGARGLTEQGSKLPLVVHDPVSRLTLLRRPAAEDEEGADEDRPEAVPMGAAFVLERGDALYLDPGKTEQVSRLISWENSFQGNVLPISLMRVHHPKALTPLPGAPLFDADGKLVALCHQESDEFGHGTYALPVEAVTKVLKDLKEHGKVVRCWIGIVMEAKYPVPTIVMVRPESPAALAGMKKGDILLSVGGHEIRSYADTVNAFYYLVDGEETEVSLLRGTERRTIKVIPELTPLEKVEG